MFPIKNSTGKIIGFGGRTIDDSMPKYLNSKGKERTQKKKTFRLLIEIDNAVYSYSITPKIK